jgi:hypothetical protein
MKFNNWVYSASLTLGVIIAALLSLPEKGAAMASFTRQTGLPCATCHYTFPELTPFGREFKLNGYTLTGMKEVTVKPSHKTESGLQLLESFPISFNARFSETFTDKTQPGTQNGNIEFPQQLNFYLASAMSDHAGATIQVTYTPGSGKLAFDNSDFRYSNRTKIGGKDVVYGLNFDNNPSQEDLWHNTPQWGFPWYPPDSTPTPASHAIISGSLAGDVGGLGAYAMWNGHLYADITGYRSMHVNGPQPPDGVGYAFNIHGVAPYWRVAWQQNIGKNYLEVGTYGMHINSSPGTVVSPTDTYTDVAADLQFERQVRNSDEITVRSSFIHEASDLNATFAAGGASLIPHRLNSFKADGTYHFGSKYAATFGGFASTGTADPVLFASAPVSGSASGNPKSNGYIMQFSYWPVQNIMLQGQYTGYLKFNGASTNYDGAGRNASDNNAAFLLLFFSF